MAEKIAEGKAKAGREVTYGDIERCPYAPGDPDYAEWSRRDTERLLRILHPEGALRQKVPNPE